MENWKKNTAAFLSSQAISILGSSLVQYAITWHITLTTKSGVFATLAILCGFLPTFFLSPFAGVWADRYDRKKLIVLADGGIALATLILAFLFMGGRQEIWLLLAAMAVRSLGGAVQQPSINALLPSLVPPEQLTRINGLNSSITSLITLISPMLSGAMMGFVPLHLIFFIDVITAIIGILILLVFVKLPERAAQDTTQKSYFTDIKQGFSYMINTPFLRRLLPLMMGIWLMIGPISFLTPLQVTRSYGEDVWRLTAIEVAFSVGMLVGGLIISAWGGLKNKTIMMGIFCGLMGLGILALGFKTIFPIYLGIMCATGLVMPMMNTPAIVLLQQKVDPNYIGRVFSIVTMLSSCIAPLGMLIFGPLADVIDIAYILLFTGGVIAIISAILLSNKTLREAGLPTPEAPAAEAA